MRIFSHLTIETCTTPTTTIGRREHEPRPGGPTPNAGLRGRLRRLGRRLADSLSHFR